MKALRFKIHHISLIGVLFTLSVSGCGREPVQVDVSVNGRGAVIMEAGTGEILFEKGADIRFPPASTAKIMTAIVAVERLPSDIEITPSKQAIYVEPTVAGLKTEVEYKLEDLLSAILIKSANDAAVVIAEAAAGDENNFARMMNVKAKEIGMENTYFATASGLPTGRKDSQYTTAKDLANMMRYALKYKVILEKLSQKEATIYGSDGKDIYLKTHNKALLKSDSAPWGKTGYTREASRTFVGTNPSMHPVIVFGLLKSTQLWDDITTLNEKGLEIYEKKHSTFLSNLISWIKSQRERGRQDLTMIRNRK